AERHRVVPVFLDREAQSNDSVPYGLRLKHGVTVSDECSLEEVAERLLELLSRSVRDGRQHDGLMENLVDFEDQRQLFGKMLEDPREKRLMFIQAPGGRGKTSLLRMLSLHCEGKDIPYCSIDSGDQPYDNAHFTLSLA